MLEKDKQQLGVKKDQNRCNRRAGDPGQRYSLGESMKINEVRMKIKQKGLCSTGGKTQK